MNVDAALGSTQLKTVFKSLDQALALSLIARGRPKEPCQRIKGLADIGEALLQTGQKDRWRPSSRTHPLPGSQSKCMGRSSTMPFHASLAFLS